MTNTNTSTVETLSAEVRVLMVGSRQVTLSVVKQLDRVRYPQLEPFGRVHSGRKDEPAADEDAIEVVGRHRETGALSYAFAFRGVYPRPNRAWKHWSWHMISQGQLKYDESYEVAGQDGESVCWTTACSTVCPALSQRNPFCFDSIGLSADRDTQRWLYEEWEYKRVMGMFCDLNAIREVWMDSAAMQLARYLAREKLRREAEQLPLIVLAGLR
jgi:hypothetical protein